MINNFTMAIFFPALNVSPNIYILPHLIYARNNYMNTKHPPQWINQSIKIQSTLHRFAPIWPTLSHECAVESREVVLSFPLLGCLPTTIVFDPVAPALLFRSLSQSLRARTGSSSVGVSTSPPSLGICSGLRTPDLRISSTLGWMIASSGI